MKQFLFIVSLALVMVGCATTRPTSTKSSSTGLWHEQSQSHTDKVLDSVLIDRLREVIVRNDTVYIRDSIYISKWRDRQVTDTIRDTLYIEQTDTITNYVEVEKPVYIDKPVSPFVRNSCIALWSMIAVAILVLIGWVMAKFATGQFSWAKIGIKLLSIFK